MKYEIKYELQNMKFYYDIKQNKHDRKWYRICTAEGRQTWQNRGTPENRRQVP